VEEKFLILSCFVFTICTGPEPQGKMADDEGRTVEGKFFAFRCVKIWPLFAILLLVLHVPPHQIGYPVRELEAFRKVAQVLADKNQMKTDRQ
jgi:hypothetical protein